MHSRAPRARPDGATAGDAEPRACAVSVCNMKPSAVVCALLLGSLCVSVSMAESGYSYRDVDAPEGGAPPVPTQQDQEAPAPRQDQEAPAPRQDQEGAGDGAPVPAKGSPLEIIAAPVPNRAEIASMDRDLAKKLSKMKELISGIHQGVDKSSKLRATSMKHKFNKLSAVIATLAGQKDALFQENVKLRREMRATVERLVRVESELKREARRADDNDLKRWFDVKAGEIAEFLHSSGLQNYEDPQFSPLVAGLVTYGLVLLPLLMASGYVTRHIKSLSLLHALMAINLFEVGYTGTTIVSMPLLGTLDPWVRAARPSPPRRPSGAAPKLHSHLFRALRRLTGPAFDRRPRRPKPRRSTRCGTSRTSTLRSCRL
jgi:hypothetical protein